MKTGTLVHRYLETHLGDESFEPSKLDRLAAETEGAPGSNEPRDEAAAVLTDFHGGEYHQRAHAEVPSRRGRCRCS